MGVVVEVADGLDAQALDMVVHGLKAEGHIGMVGVSKNVQVLFAPIAHLGHPVGHGQDAVLDRHFHKIADMKGKFCTHKISSQNQDLY